MKEENKNIFKINDNDKLLYQIASSLKSTRFILALLAIIPSMAMLGYAIVILPDAKDKLIIAGQINAISLMVLTFYFSEKLQNGKTEGK